MPHRVLLSAAFVVLGLRCAGAQGIAEGSGQRSADATPPMLSTEAIMRALQPLSRSQAPAPQEPAPAPARRDEGWRGWEIEVHGGWMLASSGNSGAGGLPPAGLSFTAGDSIG